MKVPADTDESAARRRQYSSDGGTTWSDSFSAAEGANSVQVRQTDVAGNTGPATSFAFTLDTTPPAAPGVALATDSGTPGVSGRPSVATPDPAFASSASTLP